MKEFILEVPAGTKVEIREYDNCNTITMYEKPKPILVHDLIMPELDANKEQEIVEETKEHKEQADLVAEE